MSADQFFFRVGKLYVSYCFLHTHGIDARTISKWSCRKRVSKVKHAGGTYVDYNSLPEPSRKKLPTEAHLHAQLLYKQQRRKLEKKQSASDALLHSLLTSKANYAKHLEYIRANYPLRIERATECAQRWAVWEWIMKNYTRKAGGLERLFEVYAVVFPNAYSCKRSLSNFMKDCATKGIEEAVVKKCYLNVIESTVSPSQKYWVEVLLRSGRKFSYPQIQAKIVKACADKGVEPCSLSWVKKYARSIRDGNADTYGARYGKDAQRESLPSVPLQNAKHVNTEWQIDGWTLPFWVDGQKAFERWTLVAVWDSHSRKIVGFSVGKTENTPLILEALDDAIRATGVIPAELVMDNHSFNRTKIAAHFQAETARLGMKWTTTMNPRRKNVAERYNQYLDALCKEYAGYLGKGITAKSRDARRSPDEVEALRRPANMLTPAEVKVIGADVVLSYNDAPLNPLKGKSPNTAYTASPNQYGVAVNEQQRVALIKPPMFYTVRSGCITITHQGSTRYTYALPAELYRAYNNQKVQVVYEDLEQGIYLFDTATGQTIAELRYQQPAPASHRDQTEANTKPILANSAKVKSILSRAEKERDGLLENPEDADYILRYSQPKDIRQEIAERSDLRQRARDMDVNENDLPVRTPLEFGQRKPKPKESPFYKGTDHGGKLERLTEEEIIRRFDEE